jgi:cytochrome P450
VVVLDAALDITFEAICDMLIGRTALQPDVKRRLQSDVLAVTRAMLAFPLRLPGTRFHAGLRARKRIMQVLRQEIASRQRQIMDDDRHHHHHSKHDDFLHSLLLLRLQQQQQSPSNSNDDLLLTDDQIILDNILTLIIAGMTTYMHTTPCLLNSCLLVHVLIINKKNNRPGYDSKRNYMDGQVPG